MIFPGDGIRLKHPDQARTAAVVYSVLKAHNLFADYSVHPRNLADLFSALMPHPHGLRGPARGGKPSHNDPVDGIGSC